MSNKFIDVMDKHGLIKNDPGTKCGNCNKQLTKADVDGGRCQECFSMILPLAEKDVEMPWCDYCQCYHSDKADHIQKPINLKGIRNVIVFGRIWSRKSSGSTYQSVSIYVDGKCIGKVENLNGPASMVPYHAFDWLEREGYFAPRDRRNGGIEPPWQTAERIGFSLAYESAEVAREKDL